MKKLAGIIAFAAMILLSAANANADSGDGDSEDDVMTETICLADRLGQSPGEIAENIHRADPRWNTTRSRQKVWDVIVLDAECG